MTMTINGVKCVNCGTTTDGIETPASWWEGNIPYPDDASFDGGGITLCPDCFALDRITVPVPIQVSLEDGYVTADTREATLDWAAFKDQRLSGSNDADQ